MSEANPLPPKENALPVQEPEGMQSENPRLLSTEPTSSPAVASSVDDPPSPPPSPSLAVTSPVRADSIASSSSSNRRAAASPTSQRISAALYAHGEILTWPEDWNCVELNMNENHPKYVISVLSPEVVSSMMSKHIVYTVKTEPTGYTVRRRYNDFQWLRDCLVSRYTGLFIPALPATTTFNAKSALVGGKTDVEGDFVKSRMAQLHMFAQQICRIPFLRTDPSLHAFISLQSEKDFKIAVDQGVEKVAAYENWDNEGLNSWLSAIESCPLNMVDTSRTIGDFHRQLDNIRTALDQMDRECRNIGRKAIVLAKAMQSLTEQTIAWQKVELDLLDPNKNEYKNSQGSRIRVLMNQLVAGQSFWSVTASMIPKIIARVYLSGVQFQNVQVEAFRQLLQSRDAVLKDLERAEKEKSKAFEEKEKFRTTPEQRRLSMSMSAFMKPKSLQDYEEVYKKKQEAVDLLFQQQERMTKALIFCEIDRFCRDRVEIVNTLLGSLAAINLEMALNTNIKWTEVIATAGLDKDQFREIVGFAQQALDDEDIFLEA